MKAKILDKSQEKIWDEFVLRHPLSTIHQTSDWANFQEKIAGRGKSWIIGIFKEDKLVGGTVLIKHKLPRGHCFLYSARGPLLDYSKESFPKQLDCLLKAIKEIGDKEKAIFYRIDPPLKSYPKIKGFLSAHGFQPEHTLILDLEMSEEDLLHQMKQKGRYNIRLAEKKGVSVRTSDPKDLGQFLKDVDAYYSMLQETTERDGFSGHERIVYQNMVETLAGHNYASFYIAEYQGEILAAAIVTKYKDTETYYYGVSGNHKRNLMAPYLLQWQAIKDAKKAGYKYYDFLGIAPDNAKNHPWEGVTSFKTKFGGQRLSYAPAREYALKPLLYWAFRLLKFLKRR